MCQRCSTVCKPKIFSTPCPTGYVFSQSFQFPAGHQMINTACMIRRCPSPRQGIREYRRGWVGFNIVQRPVIHTHTHTLKSSLFVLKTSCAANLNKIISIILASGMITDSKVSQSDICHFTSSGSYYQACICSIYSM